MLDVWFKKINTVNECRYTKLMSICTDDLNAIRAKKKFDTALIPPSYVAFVEHVKRVNFEVGKWKKSHEQFPSIPSPCDDNGWIIDENHVIRPLCYKGDMLP